MGETIIEDDLFHQRQFKLLYIIVVGILNVNVVHLFLSFHPGFHVPLRPLNVAFGKRKLEE
jgi:hypothetical protein